MNYKSLASKKNPFEGLSLDEKRRLVVYLGYVAVPPIPMDEVKRRWGAVLKDDECPTAFEALEMVEIIKREVLAEENIEKKASKKSGCFARFVFGLFCVAAGIAIGIVAFPYVQQNLQSGRKMRPDETKETDEGTKSSSFLPAPKRAPIHGEVAELSLPGGEKIAMIYCAPGTYLMGSPVSESCRGNDESQHRVTLTKGFWLSKDKVNQAQWISIMGNNPSKTKQFDLPVSGVSWVDCSDYVNKINACINCGARIPSEAEWEYACRESKIGRCSFINMLSGDMEWCLDIYSGDYPVSSVIDPCFGSLKDLKLGLVNELRDTLDKHADVQSNKIEVAENLLSCDEKTFEGMIVNFEETTRFALMSVRSRYLTANNVTRVCRGGVRIDNYLEMGGGGYTWRFSKTTSYRPANRWHELPSVKVKYYVRDKWSLDHITTGTDFNIKMWKRHRAPTYFGFRLCCSRLPDYEG